MRYLSVCSGIEAATKTCAKCKVEKPVAEFHKQGARGRHSYCKPCFNGRPRKRTPSPNKRGHNFKARYGITTLEADAMLASQGGVCAICGEEPKRPVVDHDHATGAVRGILCHGCNIKLPAVENPKFLRSALEYLGAEGDE